MSTQELDFLLLILGFHKERQSTLCEEWPHHCQVVDSVGREDHCEQARQMQQALHTL